MTPAKIERAEGGVELPQWAIERACERCGVDFETHADWSAFSLPSRVVRKYASYIAEHEEEPVDPLLEEAIALVINDETDRSDRQNDAIRKSGLASKQVRAALNGLRRGIELAGEAK